MPILLLDLTGVLYDYSHRSRLDALSEASGRTGDQVAEIVFGSGFFRRCIQGRIDEAGMADYLGAHLGLRDEDLDGAWASGWTPRLGAMALLQRLRPEVDRALVTNNDALMTRILRTADPIGQLVPRMLCSGDLGASKPDPGAFAAALRLLGVRAAQARFVDDTPANADAARSLGIDSAHTPDLEALEQALTAWDLLAVGGAA